VVGEDQKKALLRDLGPLTASKRVRALLDDDDNNPVVLYLHGFLATLKQIQNHVVETAQDMLKEQKDAADRRRKLEMEATQYSKPLPPPPAVPPLPASQYLEEHEGCSWGQCVVAMALFFARQPERIPAIVFGVGVDPGGTPIHKSSCYANSADDNHSEFLAHLATIGGIATIHTASTSVAPAAAAAASAAPKPSGASVASAGAPPSASPTRTQPALGTAGVALDEEGEVTGVATIRRATRKKSIFAIDMEDEMLAVRPFPSPHPPPPAPWAGQP